MTSMMPATALQTAMQNLKPGALMPKDKSSFAPTATSSAGKGVPKNIKEAAQQFEAVFLGEMFSHMFDGVKVDKMFGGGQGEKMFRSMLVQEYGKEMAKGQGIGISTQLQSMILKMQEAQQAKV